MYRLDLWSNGLSVFYAVKAVSIWSSIIYTLSLPSLTYSLSPLIPNLLAHHHACRASSSRITPISPSAINRLLTPASSLHRCAGWMPWRHCITFGFITPLVYITVSSVVYQLSPLSTGPGSLLMALEHSSTPSVDVLLIGCVD